MALPFIFANVTELDTPNLDANFNALGVGLTIPCTAVGTNAITLTPLANFPAQTSYTNNAPVFGFEAVANTTTTPVTIQVGGLPALNVYKANGAAAIGANDFLIGLTYYVAFNSALNSNAGGWVLLNPGASAATAGAVQSTFKNLVIQNGGTPNTQITLTADAVAVSDGATNFASLLSVNVTINSGTSGANGIDTGSIANSTWYAVYVIYNPTTLAVAGLISTSFTSPTLPSGFTQFSRLGSFRTDGSHNFLRILQKGRRAQYTVLSATNTANYPNMGTTTSASLTSFSTANFAPPTASEASFIGNSGTNANVTLSMNNQTSPTLSTTNPSGWQMNAASASTPQATANGLLESAAVFGTIVSAATLNMFMMGWTDNI